MKISLIRIWELADLLEKEGHTRVCQTNQRLRIEIFSDPNSDGNVTVLMPGIIQRPYIGINSPDDFFKELKKEIDAHIPKIKKLVFQDGGTIPIPDWFKDWCSEKGIEIAWVDEEIRVLQIKTSLTPDTRVTFNELIDEL